MEQRLDEIRTELAAIQDELLRLPGDEFDRRQQLRARQEQLREEVRRTATAGDLLSADQIKRRIEELEAQLEAHLDNRIPFSAAAQTGFGGGIDPGVLHAMHRRMDEIGGVEAIREQLRQLRDRLAAMERTD